MRRTLPFLLVALGVLVGCRAPTGSKGGAQDEPAFVVETWDGSRRVGRVVMGADVGPEALPVEAVRIIRREEAAEGLGVVARVEGFEPLSDAELAAYRERAEAAAKTYPGFKSILCLDYGEDALTRDGKQRYRYHALLLVLKDEGRKLADLELGFQEGRSRRRVFFARSIAPDGRSQWLDPATLEVAIPPQAAQFLDQRRRVLSGRIPGVEVGSLVEYAHEYDEYNPDVPDYFFPGFYFQGEEPVLDSIFDVRVPAGRKLNWTTRHLPEAAREPGRSSRDGDDVYRWVLRDSPPVTSEPLMPELRDVVASVHCSLFFDWKALHERTGRYQRERIEATPEIAALAKKIVVEAKSDDAKLAAIYHWVQRNVNYLSIKGSLSSGWAGHPASETLKNGYGDCTDKAIVLASLAKAVGITSYPAIVRTNDSGTATTDIPVPDANHCISLVFPDGKPRFIDSTATDYRYPYFRADDHGVKAIIHITGEILDVPVPPPADNLRDSRQSLVLAPDGSGTAVEHNAYTGSYEAGVRGFWHRVPPALRGQMMQQYLQHRCPGAVCTGFDLGELEDLTRQLTMEIRYRIPGLATRTKGLYIVAPPGLAREFAEASLPARQYAIERMTTQEYRTTLEVTCPPGHTLVGVPEPIAVHGEHLWYEGRVEAAPDGRKLTLRETLKLLTRRVPPEDYATYRKHATAIAAWTRLQLVFREDAK
jgi:transglutaminase-like putative cysteine protease